MQAAKVLSPRQVALQRGTSRPAPSQVQVKPPAPPAPLSPGFSSLLPAYLQDTSYSEMERPRRKEGRDAALAGGGSPDGSASLWPPTTVSQSSPVPQLPVSPQANAPRPVTQHVGARPSASRQVGAGPRVHSPMMLPSKPVPPPMGIVADEDDDYDDYFDNDFESDIPTPASVSVSSRPTSAAFRPSSATVRTNIAAADTFFGAPSPSASGLPQGVVFFKAAARPSSAVRPGSRATAVRPDTRGAGSDGLRPNRPTSRPGSRPGVPSQPVAPVVDDGYVDEGADDDDMGGIAFVGPEDEAKELAALLDSDEPDYDHDAFADESEQFIVNYQASKR
jgi:hypothetical protein